MRYGGLADDSRGARTGQESGSPAGGRKVWIAPGCIVCDSCENDCPEVFDVQEATCIIRPPAMSAEFLKPLTPSIIVAAEGCPVEVIKYETVEVPGEAPPPPAERGGGLRQLRSSPDVHHGRLLDGRFAGALPRRLRRGLAPPGRLARSVAPTP